MLSLRARLLGAITGLLALSGVLAAGPAVATQTAHSAATPAATQPDRPCDVETPPSGYQPLKFCAGFDKSAYRSSDIVTLVVSVTNLGSAPATGVWLPDPVNTTTGSFREYNGMSAPSLFIPDNEIVIEPGKTVTSELDGYAADPASGIVNFTDVAYQGGGNGGHAYGEGVAISAPVTAVTANYSGTVRTPDGAGLGGATITLHGPFNGINGQIGGTDHRATTDAQGQFLFTDLPGGMYGVQASAPGGWIVRIPMPGTVDVDGSAGQTAVSYAATRPWSETLHAAMAFDQPSYHVGEPAALTITLRNSGATAIDGVLASCGHAGEPNDLQPSSSAWGALDAGGVTVPAGQTVTLHVSQTVPVPALASGVLVAECAFGPDAQADFSDDPDVSTTTKVLAPLGPTVTFSIRLLTAPENGTAGGSAALYQASTHDFVAGALYGNPAEYTDVPEGTYDVVVNGGWHLLPGQSTVIDTADIASGSVLDYQVAPDRTPPSPPPTTTPTPAPTSSSTPTSTSTSGSTSASAPAGGSTTTSTTPAGAAAGSGGGQSLPFTGVDVVWPALAALLLVGAGLVTMLLVRRRRAAG